MVEHRSKGISSTSQSQCLMLIYQPAKIYHPAVKEAGQWIHKCSLHKLMGPHNPNQKPALVAVTRGGMIRLMFQEKNLRWQDVRTELDSISTSSALLSHAAMTADKG